MKNILNTISEGTIRLLYPSRCPACDSLLGMEEQNTGYCCNCSRTIKRVGKIVCMRCGKMVKEDEEYCKDCLERERLFDQSKGIYQYAGPMKEAMYRFKYSNRRMYSYTFARDAIHAYSRWIKSTGSRVIVPVPMYGKKKSIRGYNQAEEFAKALSKLSGLPYIGDLVIRTHDTPALKRLSAVERSIALKDAFKCTKVFRKKADILIVDDIFTTGATADAVAGALKTSGARRVFGLFVCIGAGDNKGGSSYGSQEL